MKLAPSTRSRFARGASLLLTAAAVTWAAAVSPASAAQPSCGDTITEDTTLEADLLECPDIGLVIGASEITLDLAGHVIDGAGVGVGIRSHGYANVRIENGTIREFARGVSVGQLPSFPGGVERGRGATGNTLRDLTISANATGVTFNRFVFDNTLEDSTIVGNTGAGISFNEPAGNHRIAHNRIMRNGSGIDLAGRDNLISHNRVQDNTLHGLRLSVPPIGLNSGSAIRDNVFKGNGTDGIAVSFFVLVPAGIVLADNNAARNGDDGIDVSCVPVQCDPGAIAIAGNRADRNVDLGIEADAGAVDGGGNRAKGNGNALECVGVTCQ